ncbi:hypothetical protein JYB62_03015 [Algoriphagus lutimaris]|uniref:hypothetical protein n=1 Tax=Algoriphagus lutimaris TaxID=613197 RepID=UPI00196B1595|nr:hypothetical protein [Algoriphagus lutimaris]MBN3518960.1 hypothetical protein [Algoriphagus lutimaris]
MDVRRRKFVQKVSLVFGAVSIPGLSWGMGSKEVVKDTKSIIHVGLKTLKFFKGGDLESNQSLESGLTVLTHVRNFNFSEFGSKKMLDALLYGGNAELIANEPESSDLPWVNSNLDGNPEFVKDYLITNRIGKKVGILGIDFEKSSRNIDETIRFVNKKADFLKQDLGCEQVYCLLTDPKLKDSNSSWEGVLSKSDQVDVFFATCASAITNNLWVFPNLKGRQTLLSIQSEREENNSEIELKESVINTFKKD